MTENTIGNLAALLFQHKELFIRFLWRKRFFCMSRFYICEHDKSVLYCSKSEKRTKKLKKIGVNEICTKGITPNIAYLA